MVAVGLVRVSSAVEALGLVAVTIGLVKLLAMSGPSKPFVAAALAVTEAEPVLKQTLDLSSQEIKV